MAIELNEIDLLELDPKNQVLMTLEMFRTYFPDMSQYIIFCKSLQEIKETLANLDKSIILNSLGKEKAIFEKINKKCFEDTGSGLKCDLSTPEGVFNYFKGVSWVKGIILERISKIEI